MSTHLVETTEEDSFLAVARYVGELLNEGQDRTVLAETPGSRFSSDCEALQAEGKFADLLSRLASQLELLFAKAAEKDLECCLNIVCHLLARVPPAQTPLATRQIAATLCSKVDQHAEQRLQGLTQLYNVVGDPRTQFAVLLDALQYAKQAQLSSLLAPVVKGRVEDWIKDWKLSPQDARKLYLAVADLLRTNKKRKALLRDAFKLTVKCLSTFEEATPAELAEIKGVAADAVAQFVASTDMFQFDLAESPAVKQLESDPQYGVLYSLLLVLLAGDLQGFEALAKANKADVEASGASYDDMRAKMRIMALLALASRSATIPFSTIKDTLALSEEGEVEAWVVRAIGKKLVEGRIDQLRGVVTITKCTPRSFGRDQWQELREQLAAWKESIKGVRELVSEQKPVVSQRPLPAAVRA
ncbi:hypothetical protein WJX72_001837 [[Myrmecia] bisecta]|uniref:Eukaryotic translation initiation factor 3 subunit M n=1 Tax=[Myrmecia] bisecta TaxID=41462 RepID=A0AAW1R4Z2_9CHLO